jgi:predicted RNase H-like nuclease (RuvC/YqgF family)
VDAKKAAAQLETSRQELDHLKKSRAHGAIGQPTYNTKGFNTDPDSALDQSRTEITRLEFEVERLKKEVDRLSKKAEKHKGQEESYKAELQRVAKQKVSSA